MATNGNTKSEIRVKDSRLRERKVRFLVSPLCGCIPPVEEVAELDSMRKWVSL